VLVFPDSFTNYFDPAVGRAAVSVLEALGYRVEVPTQPVCCGLTWMSTGQVGMAGRVLRRTLGVLRPWLDDGVDIVGLEPSCTALLRTDATELLADVPLAGRVGPATRTFAEVLAARAGDLVAAPGMDLMAPPGDLAAPLGGVAAPSRRALGAPPWQAMAQVHCHQYADLGFDADRAVLAELGVDVEVLDAGCCGLAGNFGFEKGHYEVSMACAERKLLPAVRGAGDEVAILADGFSCRTQLRQATTRRPVHLAELVAEAWGLPR